MEHGRREFAKLIACLAASSALAPRSWSSLARNSARVNIKASYRLKPFNYDGVRLLDGMLKRQLDATRDVYYNIPNDSLLFGFRRRAGLSAPGESLTGWYSNDFFNAFPQFLSGMTRISKATGDKPLRDKTLFLVHEWAQTIEPDGYFFYSRTPHLPHYVYDKTVGALTDIYEYFGEKEVLVYLDRITDWAIKNLDRTRFNSTPKKGAEEEWYTLGENLYRSYLLTGKTKYRIFAQVWHYDHYWNGLADGHPEVANYLHAYSHVNTLSSAAMAYAVSGDPKFLRTITNAYDYFRATQCYGTGGYGPSESLRPPDGALGAALEDDKNTFETPCGSWAVFKLSRYLMGFTGEARYGDWIEQLVYNGIGAALPMTEKGETFYYSDYRLNGGKKVYNGSTWPCCSGTYPLAVADYHNLIYFKGHDGLYVNLFVPSEVVWHYRDREVTLRQETLYPESEIVTLTVDVPSALRFPLNLRVPGWARDGIAVKINGFAENAQAAPGKWTKIERTWKPGDKIEFRVPLKFVFAPVDVQHPKRVTAVRGPVVFVRKGSGAQFADIPASQTDATNLTSLLGAGRLAPFYEMGKGEPYSMYFDLKD